MGILNVTPDSFSDGGKHYSLDAALQHAEKMIGDGADIIDIGGESTRPGSERVATDEEIRRTLPVIEAIKKRFEIPISIDTSKSEVAQRAVDAGAEVLNDISGLRWDSRMAEVAATSGAGLVLMHSRGHFGEMHSLPPVMDILAEVTADLRRSIQIASDCGVASSQIVLDIGIGFGKTLEQNLELIANLSKIAHLFDGFPILAGISRKSFIGRLLGDVPADGRLTGSLAASAIALWNGANLLRTHDVRATREMAVTVASLSRTRSLPV